MCVYFPLATRETIDVQEPKETSALSNVARIVDSRLPVFSSHCKSQLEFDLSPALQYEMDTGSEVSIRQPTLHRAQGSFVCCTLVTGYLNQK